MQSLKQNHLANNKHNVSFLARMLMSDNYTIYNITATINHRKMTQSHLIANREAANRSPLSPLWLSSAYSNLQVFSFKYAGTLLAPNVFLTHKVMMPPAPQSVSTSDWPRHSICKRPLSSPRALMETDAFLLRLSRLFFPGTRQLRRAKGKEKRKRWFSPWSEEEERGNLLIGLGPPWLSVVNNNLLSGTNQCPWAA